MRIVGGNFSGRRIIAPKGEITRPTTDRTREALFNILAHHDDITLEGASVIDLFAGSGALGLEALSRRARYCLFVEEAPRVRAIIRENIEALSLFGQTRIHRRSAIRLGTIPASAGGPFSLAFLDPPYRKGLAEPSLSGLHQGGWLTSGAHAIVEQALDENPLAIEPFQIIDTREYGDTKITILHYQPTL